MARTQYYCASSLDGYIAEADDTLEWLLGYQGSYEGEDAKPARGYDEFYEGIGALVSGSVTYEFVLEHMDEGDEWPYAGKPTWVLTSRRLAIPDGDGVDIRFADASVEELHPEMVEAAGDRDLWVIGGGNVASQFADAGLLDDVIVTVVPVVLGDGKPLFDRRPPGGPMQLVDAFPRRSGMVELRYEVRR
jgi:dihydrofolate reductase